MCIVERSTVVYVASACLLTATLGAQLAVAVPIEHAVVRQLALSGQPPEGYFSLGSFTHFSGPPVIDDHRNVAFLAEIGSGVSRSGVWMATGSELQPVALSGDAAPGAAADFEAFSELSSAGDGVLAFKATLGGPATNADTRNSIWAYQSASLQLIARTGEEAPNPSADLRYSGFDTPVTVSSAGHIAFFARTRDKEDAAAVSSGLWVAETSGKSFVANADGQAVSGEPSVVFSPQSFEAPFAEDPAVSPSGQTVFRGFLTGPGVDDSNGNGLWSYTPTDGLQLWLRAGDAVDGPDGPIFLSFPSVPTINAAGDSAFLAFVGAPHGEQNALSSGDDGEDHDHDAEFGLGLWLRSATGELQRVFMIGDNAPGVDGDVHFADAFDPVMNATGRVALVTAVEGEGITHANEAGLWSSGMSADGTLRLVARQGDQAPGADGGFVFGVFLEPSLNASGQSAFMAAGYRQEAGEVIDRGFGIWGQSRTGELRLVARVGQMLEVGPGEYREIATLEFASGTGGEDGRARGLNDLGQVVFRAAFTDGSSGIFTSNVLAIPEPPGCTLLLLAMAGIYYRRRFGRSMA
jgi:hypothetical protein